MSFDKPIVPIAEKISASGETMESIESQTVETTIGEVISSLREEAGENKERENQIIAAYLLSGLFGSVGLCSRSWH